MAAIRVPITNVYAGNDYTAQIAIGSKQAPANVILDTGSSTLAVSSKVYNPEQDEHKELTPLAQEIGYVTGGWAGPVLKTTVAMGEAAEPVETYIALADEQQPHNFGGADGILGLAYNELNEAYDLTSYLAKQGVASGDSYPWPFPIKSFSVIARLLQKIFQRLPMRDLPPYFTALEEAGVEKNKFAFYTLRSFPSHGTGDPATDALNNGTFVLGGGEEMNEFYDGAFVDVDVVDDLFYNTELLSVQVGHAEAVDIQPLPPEVSRTLISNSVVDSGTNILALAADVLDAILSSLKSLNPAFLEKIEAAARDGIATEELQLDEWPDITFTLKGANGEPVSLTCAPMTYWQVDFPAAGQAAFVISATREQQSILGLPLLNNYYTVFDRSEDPYGVIRFAPIRQPPPPPA